MKVICFSYYNVSLVNFMGTYFNGEVRALPQLESTLPLAARRVNTKGLSYLASCGRGYGGSYQPPTVQVPHIRNTDQA